MAIHAPCSLQCKVNEEGVETAVGGSQQGWPVEWLRFQHSSVLPVCQLTAVRAYGCTQGLAPGAPCT